jgi:hypothetical protein
MRSLKIAAAAMALAMPGMAMAATDGTPGATSTGTFVTSVQIVPPTGTTVQVLGLEDVNFGTVNTSSTANTIVPSFQQYLCLNRSDAGSINVNFTQSGNVINQALALNGPVAPLPLYFILNDPNGVLLASASTDATIVGAAQSSSNCTASSGAGTAHSLTIGLYDLPTNNASQALAGNYSGTFMILLSVP